MKAAVYVNQTRHVPYADAIAAALKPIETRTRDTLGRFVGQRVLIVRTSSSRKPMIIGSVFISAKAFHSAAELDEMRGLTLIPPGSKFDCSGRGKWCYTLQDPVRYAAEIPLDSVTITHKTRTFVLIDEKNSDFPEFYC